jgi:hypothetical protein
MIEKLANVCLDHLVHTDLVYLVHSKQGAKLKGYYPYFGVQPFTFLSKYFATLQKGRGNFM